MSEGELIDIKPSAGAVTKAGKANFNRFSDGSAEFVDNSIQAYRRLENVVGDCDEIQLRLFLHKNGVDSYFVIADRACGMTKTCVREFAQFALDKESRGQGDEKFISKFGVGAKQSGFFLGDRIHLISRAAHSKKDVEENCGPSEIFDFIWDAEAMEARQSSGQEDVWRERLFSRSRTCDSSRSPQDERDCAELQDFVREFETQPDGSDAPHFTIMVLKLRPRIVRDLWARDRYREVPYELAQIYHFYLHPENLPDKMEEKFDFKNILDHDEMNLLKEAAKARKVRMAQNRSNNTKRLQERERCGYSTRLRIVFSVMSNGELLIEQDLGKLDDDVSVCFHQAVACFRFNISFPDPEHTSDSSVVDKTKDSRYHNQMTAAKKMSTAQGVVFYYPYKGDKETRPVARSRKVPFLEYQGNGRSGSGSKYKTCSHSQSQKSQSGGMSKSDAIDIEDIDELDSDEELFPSQSDLANRLFDIYWVNRFVPQSTLSTAPFFPKNLDSVNKCDYANVPVNWKDRLRGFIFFDHEWGCISNNKLKIQVDPDIDAYINTRCSGEVKIDPEILTGNTFKKWLQACHKHFDQETHFSHRWGALEDILSTRHYRDTQIARKLQLQDVDDFNVAVFKSLEIRGNIPITIRKGQTVKIRLSKDGSAAKRGTTIYAKILSFDVPRNEVKNHLTDQCYGKGKLRYLRLPLAIYHPTISAALSKIEERGDVPMPHRQESTQSQRSNDDIDGNGIGFLTGEGLSLELGDNKNLKKLAIQPEFFFLNKPVSVMAINVDDYHVDDRLLRDIEKTAPHEAKLFLFDIAGGKNRQLNNIEKEVGINVNYYKIGCQIFDAYGNLCCRPPSEGNSKKAREQYKLRLELLTLIKQDNGEYIEDVIKDYGTHSDWYTFNKSEKLDVKSSTLVKGLTDQSFISFYGPKTRHGATANVASLQFKKAGKFELRASVIDPLSDTVVLRQKVIIKVRPEKINSFCLKHAVGDHGYKKDDIQILGEDILPDFCIEFRDSKNAPIAGGNQSVQVRVKADLCDVFEVDEVVASQNSVLNSGPWELSMANSSDEAGRLKLPNFKVRPKLAQQFMSHEMITNEKDVTFSVSVFTCPDSGKKSKSGGNAYTELLGEESYVVTFKPGTAATVILLSSNDNNDTTGSPIEVQDGENLPALRMALLDEYGFRTDNIGYNSYPTPADCRNRYTLRLVEEEDVVYDENLPSKVLEFNAGDGTITLHAHTLRAHRSSLRAPAMKSTVKFALYVRSIHPNGKEEEIGTGVTFILNLFINLKVVPTIIRLYHNGSPVVGNIPAVVGKALTGLSFAIMDGHEDDENPPNRLLEYDPLWERGSLGCGLCIGGGCGDEWDPEFVPLENTSQLTSRTQRNKRSKKVIGNSNPNLDSLVGVGSKTRGSSSNNMLEKYSDLPQVTDDGLYPLPDVQIPKQAKIHEYYLKVRIQGLPIEEEPFAFGVSAGAAEGVQWKIISRIAEDFTTPVAELHSRDENQKVPCGNPADVSAKLAAVLLEDVYGNSVAWSSKYPLPNLSAVFSVDEEEEEEEEDHDEEEEEEEEEEERGRGRGRKRERRESLAKNKSGKKNTNKGRNKQRNGTMPSQTIPLERGSYLPSKRMYSSVFPMEDGPVEEEGSSSSTAISGTRSSISSRQGMIPCFIVAKSFQGLNPPPQENISSESFPIEFTLQLTTKPVHVLLANSAPSSAGPDHSRQLFQIRSYQRRMRLVPGTPHFVFFRCENLGIPEVAKQNSAEVNKLTVVSLKVCLKDGSGNVCELPRGKKGDLKMQLVLKDSEGQENSIELYVLMTSIYLFLLSFLFLLYSLFFGCFVSYLSHCSVFI